MAHNAYPESESGDPEAPFRLWLLEAAHIKCQSLLRRPLNFEQPTLTYIVEAQKDETVPAPHYTYIMGPYPGYDPIDGITAVYFHTLTQYYHHIDESGVQSRRDTPAFNDTFLELVYGPEESRRKYLVNTREISEYDDVTKLRKNPDMVHTGDLFIHVGELAGSESASPPDAPTPRLLLEIIDQYAVLEQNNAR
jgi:hypothetical protein